MAMEAAPNRRSFVRLQALRALLLGYSRAQVCELCARTDRMLRLWIAMFNRGGIDALITKARPGRRRKVKLERVRDLLLPVLENPASVGQGHWTAVKLHGYLKEQLQLEFGYSTAVRWLHELNFHLRVPQPWPERQNEEQRRVFLEELRTLGAAPKVELWFGDESGIEGDPRPRRRWVQPGKTRTVPYLGDHIRQNVIGAVAPQTGELFTLIVDGVDTDVFQCFLDEFAKTVPRKAGVRQLLILDNASWHKSRRLNWHHFEPKFLPGYSPDFNPIERLWLRLKADWFWDYIARTPEQLIDRLCTALKSFLTQPDKTASICSIRK